ncbi:hypothetical protein L218DRAFT_943101 [Marasmius fiardii PR-910]|nr:hypothetical protein L218DRAFT_943101 [Marasmius fiardii PR-910]
MAEMESQLLSYRWTSHILEVLVEHLPRELSQTSHFNGRGIESNPNVLHHSESSSENLELPYAKAMQRCLLKSGVSHPQVMLNTNQYPHTRISYLDLGIPCTIGSEGPMYHKDEQADWTKVLPVGTMGLSTIHIGVVHTMNQVFELVSTSLGSPGYGALSSNFQAQGFSEEPVGLPKMDFHHPTVSNIDTEIHVHGSLVQGYSPILDASAKVYQLEPILNIPGIGFAYIKHVLGSFNVWLSNLMPWYSDEPLSKEIGSVEGSSLSSLGRLSPPQLLHSDSVSETSSSGDTLCIHTILEVALQKFGYIS